MATIRVDALQSYWTNSSCPNTFYGTTDFLRLYNTPSGGEGTFYIQFPIDGIASFSYCLMHLIVTDTDGSHRDIGFPIFINQITSGWDVTSTGVTGSWDNYGTAWFTDVIATYRDQWFSGSKLTTNEDNFNRYDISSFVNTAKNRGDTLVSVQVGWEATGGVWSLHHVDVGAANTAFTPYIMFYGATATEAGTSHTYPTITNPLNTDTFLYPDKMTPVIPAGKFGIQASNDTYLDRTRYPTKSPALSSLLRVQGGDKGTQTIYLDFSLAGVIEARSATLQMYCVNSSFDGDYLPLVLEMRYSGWTEDQMPEDIRAITKSLYNRVYADAQVVNGVVSIDVTNFVQTALGMGLSGLSFSIDTTQQPDCKTYYMVFASKNSSAGFKPILIIDYIVPTPSTNGQQPDEDCATDPDRPTQRLLPTPIINHGWEEYPVSAVEQQLYWVHFPLDSVNGTIKQAILHFTVTETSSWNENYDTYSLAIFGHYLPFDQTTWNYGSHTSSRDLGLACTLNTSDYIGQTKEVAFDITPIIHYSQYDGGILLSIGGEASKICTLMIAGRVSGDYPYLTLTVEDYDHPSAVVDTDAGKIIAYPTEVSNYESYEDQHHGIGNLELSGSGGIRCYFNLNTLGVPADAFGKINYAVLHVPLISLYDKFGGTLDNSYYQGIELHTYFCNNDDEYLEVGNYDVEYIYNVTISQRQTYLEIPADILIRKDARNLALTTDGIFCFNVNLGGHLNRYGTSEMGTNDNFRFGTVEGDYPPYLELRWNDEWVNYYVSTVNGSDLNDGMSIQTPWATVDHAMNNVPENHALYLESLWSQYSGGTFSYEPSNNRIAPLNNHITVIPYYPDTQYPIDVNNPPYAFMPYSVYPLDKSGTEYASFDTLSEYGFPVDGQYTITQTYNSGGTSIAKKYGYTKFDIGETTYPVLSATLKVPIISRQYADYLYVGLMEDATFTFTWHYIDANILQSTPFDLLIDVTWIVNTNPEHNPATPNIVPFRFEPKIVWENKYSKTGVVVFGEPSLLVAKTQEELERSDW